MIRRESFSEEHIRLLQKNSKRDPGIIEKTIYAFGLLEALASTGLPFIFKGGTCLMLLLDKPKRLSTDIDIIVEPGVQVDKYLEKISKAFPFKYHEEQIRSAKSDIEKRHFKFFYDSYVMEKESYVLLDILFEENNYEGVVKKKIDNELLISEGKGEVITIPSINSILGDKLTAFAPHTIGIPIDSGKNMEIAKQMYDVCTLIDVFDDYDEMKQSYLNTVAQEIRYRNKELKLEQVLEDTFNAALCIASRGKYNPKEYSSYADGFRALKGHIYSDNYSLEIAARDAVKVIYLISCIKKGEPFKRIEEIEKYKNMKYSNDILIPLKYLKKIDLEAYGYSIETDALISND